MARTTSKSKSSSKPVSAATKKKVAKDVKAESKAQAKATNPNEEKVRALVLQGKGPSEIHKLVGCRRGYARRILKAELKKLSAPYTVTARIVGGKVIQVEAAKRAFGKKAEAVVPPAPVRFDVRDVTCEDGKTKCVAIFDLTTDARLDGCSFRLKNKSDAVEAAALADRYVLLSADNLNKIIAEVATDDRWQAVVAKAVLAIITGPQPEAAAEITPEVQPEEVKAA